MNKELVDLIEQMLDINPYTRITATQIKFHPYFAEHKIPDSHSFHELKSTSDGVIPISLNPLKDRDTFLNQLYAYTLENKLENVFVLAVNIWDGYLAKLGDLTGVDCFQVGQVCLKLATIIVNISNISTDKETTSNFEKQTMKHIYILLQGKLYQHTFDYLASLKNYQIEYSFCLSIIKRSDFYKNNANYWERKLVVQLFCSQHSNAFKELSSTTNLPEDLLNLILEYYLL